MRDFLADRVKSIPPSGIRKFFDIVATMDDVISLGIGEPDFVTPPALMQAGISSLQAGHTGYTSNSGLFELREGLAKHLHCLYGIAFEAAAEILVA
ncbi:MAG: pyridoxal phosphate-dependent aminotransferase, partial [Chloroflexi bacterium]|nr:pyridoxal phosphate-dependent aminotransferase [Chloroflexota bacterium]